MGSFELKAFRESRGPEQPCSRTVLSATCSWMPHDLLKQLLLNSVKTALLRSLDAIPAARVSPTHRRSDRRCSVQLQDCRSPRRVACRVWRSPTRPSNEETYPGAGACQQSKSLIDTEIETATETFHPCDALQEIKPPMIFEELNHGVLGQDKALRFVSVASLSSTCHRQDAWQYLDDR